MLGASNLSMLRYEWVWYKSRCTGFLNARRAPLKRTENILVFYQKLPYYYGMNALSHNVIMADRKKLKSA